MPIARSHGMKIAYEVFGDGPPLVLHPGMFQTGSHWTVAGYTPALAANHTVIAIDPLGLGASDAPHEPAAYTLRRRADSVTAVLDDLGIARAAFWGYSLGALTGYAVAGHAPERLTRLVAGAFDPVDGFRSAIETTLRQLNLPADTDPYVLVRQGAYGQAAQRVVIDAGDEAAFRANYDAFSQEPGAHVELAAAGVPILMYAGTADPWHDPMRGFADRVGAGFFAIPEADHSAAWWRATEVLPQVLPFLAQDGHQG